VYISGLWGAGGQYWLRGHLPDSEDPGILYRSTDGLAWQQSRSLGITIQSLSVVDGCSASMTGARDACPVFMTGSKGVDGAIWRSADGGASWAKASVADATGWMGTQDAAPVEILGIVATSDELLAYGNGLPNASDTGGYRQARVWRSADGTNGNRQARGCGPRGRRHRDGRPRNPMRRRRDRPPRRRRAPPTGPRGAAAPRKSGRPRAGRASRGDCRAAAL